MTDHTDADIAALSPFPAMSVVGCPKVGPMGSGNVADELMESLAEMAAHARGDGPALTVRTVDVPDVDVQAVRDWERKRRGPG